MTMDSSDDPADTPTEVYEIEAITAARVATDRDGAWDYRIRWVGYGPESDSWEPDEHVLKGAEGILRRFWAHIGMDNDDYEPGYVVKPKKSWVDSEIRRSKRERGARDDDDDKDSKEHRMNSKKRRAMDEPLVKQENRDTKKRRASMSKPRKMSISISDTDAESDIKPRIRGAKSRKKSIVPLSDAETSAASARSKSKGKTSNGEDSPSESATSSEDDVPLDQARKSKKPQPKPKPPPLKTKTKAIKADPSSAVDKGKGKAKAAASTSAAPYAKPISTDGGKNKKPVSTDGGKNKKPISTDGGKNKKPISTDGGKNRKPAVVSRSSSVESVNSLFDEGVESKTNAANAVPTKKPPYGAHRGRTPKVKLMEDPNLAPSGTSTKRLLANNVFGPKGAGTAATNLAKLSFRKTTEAPEALVQPLSAGSERPALTVDTDLADDWGVPDMEPPPQSAMSPPPTTSAVEAQDVEAFLESAEREQRAQVAAPRIVKKSGSLSFRRNWTWSGELRVQVSDKDEAERWCDVTISDAENLPQSGAPKLQLKWVMDTHDTLGMEKMHAVANLAILQEACKARTQIVKIGPGARDDESSLQLLATHLKTKLSVSVVTLTVAEVSAGVFVIFPSSNIQVGAKLGVPSDLQKDDGFFMGVVLPWKIADQYAPLRWFRADRKLHARAAFPSVPRGGAQVHLADMGLGPPDAAFVRAVHILRFPHWLLKRVSDKDWQRRTYCVWDPPDERAPDRLGRETRALRAVLRRAGAEDVGYKADLRTVFVHVSAMRTLYRLPALSERRTKRPEIVFVLYGTHPTVHPSMWGAREIWPIGGVVTFTPTMIVEKPELVVEIARRAAQHPLWMCFIIPSVLGAAATTWAASTDPMEIFDLGIFPGDSILQLIEDGKISLMDAPPAPHTSDTAETAWLAAQLGQLPLDARGLLALALQAHVTQYASVPAHTRPAALLADIRRQLGALQFAPAIMAEYRRFVAIQDPAERIEANDSGFEWVAPHEFRMRDGTDPKQEKTA